MSLFAAALPHLTRLELVLWAEVIVVFYLLLVCFIRVSGYAANRFWAGKLVNGVNAPPAYQMPPLGTWLLTFDVMTLLLMQNILYTVAVILGLTWLILQSRRNGSEDRIIPQAGGWLFIMNILALLFLQSPLYYLVVVGGIALYLLESGKSAREQFGLERLSATRLAKWSLLVCGAVIFLEIPLDAVVQAAFNTIHLPHPEQETVVSFQQLNQASQIFAFLVQAVVIAPLLEELFFRGFLQTYLKNYTSTWLAVVLSAGVFAFVHANLGSALQLWFLGLALGIAYEHTGALLLPVGVHGCFNFATALSLLLEKGVS